MATKKVNIDIIARDKSKQALKGVRGSLDKVKKSVFNVRNALLGLGTGLAIRSIVKTGMEIENLQVRLKFLFGTAEEGAKAFDEMAKFAAKVPFSLAQIQQGAGVLAVVSKDADELAKVMELTGNVAAVTGLDFKTTAEQIQRSLSAGISAADLFRDRGVKAMLGFKAGATVTVEETAEAFERVFGKDGKFGGATDELAKTLGGTFSMLGDKVFRFKQVLLDSGFFSELKTSFGELNTFVAENQEAFDMLAKFIGGTLTVILKALVLTVKGIALAFGKVKDVLQEITDFVGITDEAVREQINLLKQNSEAAMQMRNSLDLVIKVQMKEAEQLEKNTKLLKQVPPILQAQGVQWKSVTEIMGENNKTLEETNTLFDSFKDGFKEAMNVDIFKEFESIGKQTFENLKGVLSDFVMTGKLNFQSLKEFIIKSMVEALIGQAIQSALAKAVAMFKASAIREALMGVYGAAIKAFKNFGGFPFGAMAAAATVATGMVMVNKIKGFEKGGKPPVGQPSIVGESGAELFVPSSAGTIVPNNQLGGKPVTVNFNINTVDASGFNQLLVNSRGVIINMINSAVNEKGRAAII